MKVELDKKIDEGQFNVDSQSSQNKAPSKSAQCKPSDQEIGNVFRKLNECKNKPAILSLISLYADSFILKSRRISTLSDLFDPENLKLNYVDLLTECSEIDISLSESEIETIEEDTREQSRTSAFFIYRAGRIGASQSHTVFHTNVEQPSISLVKAVCYTQLFKVTTEGNRNYLD